MKPLPLVALLAMTVLATACETASVRAVLYYSLTQVGESAANEHYQQFAEINDAVVDLGCLVVQRRQVNCFDNAGNGAPNLRLAVVECACPCTELEADVCDPARPMVRAGVIRGVVNHSEGPVVLGGVEIPTEIELGAASGLFITREANDDDSPLPSTDLFLGGRLERDGAVVRGTLTSPSIELTQGIVTIVPVRDEVSL